MRLTDLDPSWLSANRGRHGQGITFRCPHCDEMMFVAFDNPLDGGAPMKESGPLWKREGATFETLSLTPSIDKPNHWHGWIQNGEVTNT